MITSLNEKVSMFATNDELYDKLTNKEIMTIKLAKVDEFVDDLYRSGLCEHNAKLFPADQSYFKLKELLKELNELNDWYNYYNHYYINLINL